MIRIIVVGVVTIVLFTGLLVYGWKRLKEDILHDLTL